MVFGKFSWAILLLLFGYNSIFAQDEVIFALIEKFDDPSYSVREEAAKELRLYGVPIAKPLLEKLVDATQTPEVRRLCTKALLNLMVNTRKPPYETLAEKVREYDVKKYPHAAKELKLLRAEILGVPDAQTERAVNWLQKKGCRVSKFGNHVYIDTRGYRGSKEDFKKLTDIKGKIHLRIDVDQHHSLFEVLPKARLFKLFVVSRNSQPKKDGVLDRQISAAFKNVFKCTSIEILIMRCFPEDDVLSSIDKLSNLRIVLLPPTATDKTIAKLGQLPKLASIQTAAQFRELGRKIDGSGFKEFNENKLVTSMHFYRANIKTENLKYLSKFPNLTRISLSEDCTTKDVEIVCKLFPALTHISAGSPNVNDQILKPLVKMEHLVHLSLIDCSITDRFVEKLNQLKKLQDFKCAGNWITKKTFESIPISKRKHSPSSSQVFFKPRSEREKEAVYKLVDAGAPIRPDSTGVSLTIGKSSAFNFQKFRKEFEEIWFCNIDLLSTPTPEKLEFIKDLNFNGRLKIWEPEIPDAIVEKLKRKFFDQVVDKRKRVRNQ